MRKISFKSEETISTKLFSYFVHPTITKTYIYMQLFTKEVHTGNMPKTLTILNDLLPTIFKSKCFNTENIPFKTEVKRTELGHLFEHILLEYLCILKIEKGFDEATFSGVTDWDWTKNPKGSFMITISINKKDNDIFPKALKNSISLFSLILEKNIKAKGIKRGRKFSTPLSFLS